MAFQDEWPLMADGNRFDGKNLWSLLSRGESPFKNCWDVNLLIKEVEDALHSRITNIPFVYNGSNSYVGYHKAIGQDVMIVLISGQGFHFELEDHPDVVARICRGDVNMPNYDGFSEKQLALDIRFEAAVYQLLQSKPAIRSSRLLYHRIPKSTDGPKVDIPRDISGRHLLVFERLNGENNVWKGIDQIQQDHLLKQAAAIRGELFNFILPQDFAVTWLRERLFEQKPSSIPVSVSSTRDFTLSLFEAKINATIKNPGDMIGWDSDCQVVGPVAFAAKKSLLRLIPHILPSEVERQKPCLYRLVLDHGDFGIHNMQISMDDELGEPIVRSIYDWETGSIVPAILSDPLMAVTVDLITDEKAQPSYTRVSLEATYQDVKNYQHWSSKYFQELYQRAPDYRKVIVAGRDARYLWFKLRDWRGEDPEGYFGLLGSWAENLIKRSKND